jgi:hypothetical protein
MPAKKTPRIAEAAPAYTARSGTTRRPRQTKGNARAKKPSSGEALWQYFLTLPDEEQSAFVKSMLKSRAWREELGDSLTVFESTNERLMPIEQYWAERDRRK